ncbi:hypothetical protein FDP41_002444 [Naegleria fowleri]|uniref:Uncharacterized protein n=1 Tax=Naegleria fowleri TaxID=5763 RepID=A0A6A5BWE6_NAEFO|nr:uncharacterized protein FDP41_002444 [Naegleria fowleri]KAF0978624.1 hypothetical protein FDP41_002444 [Naegleria fowleri]
MGILNHQHALLIQTEEDLVPTLDHKWLDEPKLLQQLLKTKDGKETILSYPYIACMFRSTPSQVKKKVKPLLDELGIEMPVFDFNKNRIRDYFSTYLQVDGFTTNNNSNQDHSQFIENSDDNNSTSDDIASQHHGADVSPNMSSFSHANNDEEQEMSSFIPSFENGPLTNLDDTSPHTTRQPPIMSFTPQSPSNIQLTIGNNFEFLSSWTNPPTFVSLEQDALHNTLWGEDFLSSMHSSSNQQQLPFLYCSNSSGNNMESPQNPPFVVGVNPNTPHVVGEELFDFSFMNSNEDIFSLNFQ